jgi:predicted regulator of Ras-like GTPase activity (Roadblock/LC7/MglB family)
MLSRPGSRRHFDVVDPSDGSVLATVTDGDVDDAEQAVAMAAAAATAWQFGVAALDLLPGGRDLPDQLVGSDVGARGST